MPHAPRATSFRGLRVRRLHSAAQSDHPGCPRAEDECSASVARASGARDRRLPLPPRSHRCRSLPARGRPRPGCPWSVGADLSQVRAPRANPAAPLRRLPRRSRARADRWRRARAPGIADRIRGSVHTELAVSTWARSASISASSRIMFEFHPGRRRPAVRASNTIERHFQREVS